MSRDNHQVVDNLISKLDQVIKRRNVGNGATPIDQFSEYARPQDRFVRVADNQAPITKKRTENKLLAEIDASIRAYIEAPALVSNSRIEIGQAEYIWPGICMSDIARDTGLTLGGVSRIFNGMRKARKATLISIANLYTDGDVGQVEQAIIKRVCKQINRPMTPTELKSEKRQQQIKIIGLYETEKRN